jgi:hypothetical protein
MMTRSSFAGSLALSALGADGSRSVRVDSDGMLRNDDRREFIVSV